jgi:hypothetical protein
MHIARAYRGRVFAEAVVEDVFLPVVPV